MQPDVCRECQLLFHEFGHAEGRHAKLVLDRKHLPRDGDYEAAELEMEILLAERERQRIRRLIEEHEAEWHAHAGAPSGAVRTPMD